MKMRKILSFVLVLSLVLGSFSMAFAATPATNLSDIAGITNEEAVQVNSDLGIINGFPDGTFKPEQMVTRAEFAAMMTRALAIPESALAGYSTTSFKDMSGYGWATGYIAFCQSKGIMIGDGFGNAMPGRTINVNEAMTMVLRAIGYVNHSSVLVGTWPANYVTVAQNVGLYDDVASAVTVDRANAAQIIYNALTVQKVAVNSDGETTYLTTGTAPNVKEVNLLNSGLNAESNEELVVYGDDSMISLTKYVGAWANVYRDDKGNGDIVAIEPISTFLTGEYKTSNQKFTANGVEYTLKDAASLSAYGITNAAMDSSTTAALTLLGNEVERTIAVDVSGKTITKVYSVANWIVSEDEAADKNTQEEINDDQELLGETFKLDNDNEIDFTSFELVGVSSLDKIAADDVVYVYTLGNGSTDIVKVAVGTEVVTGDFTKFSGDSLTIGGKVYKMADKADVNFAAAFGKTAPDYTYLGEEIELTLDAYGNIYSWEATAKTADKYAVVSALDTGGFDDSRVKLYLSSDETKIFTIDDDSNVTLADFTTPQVIAYSVNTDGEIDAVEKTVVAADSATMTGLKTLLVGTTYYAIDADAVVFTVTISGLTVTYDVTSIGKVNLNEELSAGTGLFTYVLNSDDEVAAMVINADKASRDSDDVYAVINNKTTVYDVELDKAVAELTGFFDGTEGTKNATTTLTGNATKGGLYLVTFDADGYVKNASNIALISTSFGGTNVAGDVVQVGTTMVSLSDDVVVYEKVYKTDGSFDKFVVSSTNKIKATANIFTLDIDAAEEDGAEIVVWSEKAL